MTSKTRTTIMARDLAGRTGAPYQTCQAVAAALAPLVVRAGAEEVAAALEHALTAAQPLRWPHQLVSSERVLEAHPEPTGTFVCTLHRNGRDILDELLDPEWDKVRPPVKPTGSPMLLSRGRWGAALMIPVEPAVGELPGPEASAYLELRLDEGARPPVEHAVVTWAPFWQALQGGPEPWGPELRFELPYWQTGPEHLDLPPEGGAGLGTRLAPEQQPLAQVVDRLGWVWLVYDACGWEGGKDFVHEPVAVPDLLIRWAQQDFSGSLEDLNVYSDETGEGAEVRRWWGADEGGPTRLWIAA